MDKIRALRMLHYYHVFDSVVDSAYCLGVVATSFYDLHITYDPMTYILYDLMTYTYMTSCDTCNFAS